MVTRPPAFARFLRATHATLLLSSALATVCPPTRADDLTQIGLGAYHTTARGGVFASAAAPPAATFRSGPLLEQAAPTNQWYSSLVFHATSAPLHAHPMTYQVTPRGFEIGLPERQRVVPDAGQRAIRYAHRPAITVAPIQFQPHDGRLSKASNWLVEVSMAASATETLKATVLHGSPFSYFECSTGDVRFTFNGETQPIAGLQARNSDPRVVAVTIGSRHYAIFAPTGGKFEWQGNSVVILHLPYQRRYFSVAGLPNDQADTLQDFLNVAYAFPTQTHVEWHYDQARSRITTDFSVDTVAREGTNRDTLMGLYPHHWSALPQPLEASYRYDSVRGAIRLIRANHFRIERTYHGLLPRWGELEDVADRNAVDSLLVGDLAKSDQLFLKNGRGSYWIGKGLGGLSQLVSIAEAEDKPATRDQLLASLKKRLESWFDGKHATYFSQDARIGSMLAYPEEYASVTSMNDHHFHYGYWITAAAHVALRDPHWADDTQWGGMVEKLVADIATRQHDRADFPFLRNFDVYEGHSWASGDGTTLEDGNNQESSSEAVNAWAGLLLWAEATHQPALRDLAIYLYTSEIASVQQYWFDLDHQVLAPDFEHPFASMVFGGKYAYNTWWTEEPRQIYGINLLPITPASTYLGQDPGYVERYIGAIAPARKAHDLHGVPDGTKPDIWQDIFAEDLALADPVKALALWDRHGSVEFGETRTHTLYWMLSLKEMGRPDFTITANTPLYGVFGDTSRRTYLAYNAGDQPITVAFSDGRTMSVAAHSLGRIH